MPRYDLLERTREFALAVTVFCRTLPRTDEAADAGRQLRRAANSVRSNYRAARNGRSHREFTAKLAEAFEEADECRDWLEYLDQSGIGSDRRLLQEATELTRILAASVKTARITMARAARTPARSRRRAGDA